MTEQAFLITFIKTLNEDDSKNFAGFRIMSKEQAKLFMKALRRLSAKFSEFYFNDLSFTYSEEDFTLSKLSASDRKTLEKFFNVTVDEGQIGVFPDAVDDALTIGLIDEYEDSDEDERSAEDDEEDY